MTLRPRVAAQPKAGIVHRHTGQEQPVGGLGNPIRLQGAVAVQVANACQWRRTEPTRCIASWSTTENQPSWLNRRSGHRRPEHEGLGVAARCTQDDVRDDTRDAPGVVAGLGCGHRRWRLRDLQHTGSQNRRHRCSRHLHSTHNSSGHTNTFAQPGTELFGSKQNTGNHPPQEAVFPARSAVSDAR